MHRGSVSAMLSSMSDALMQRNVTRSHLEHQIAAAVVLKSSAEYRYWYEDCSPLKEMSWTLLILECEQLQDPCVRQVPHARRRCVAVGRLVCGHDGSLPCVGSIRTDVLLSEISSRLTAMFCIAGRQLAPTALRQTVSRRQSPADGTRWCWYVLLVISLPVHFV